MSELRKDPVSGRWVIIAPERARRPKASFWEGEEIKSLSEDYVCPFCPGNEHMTAPSIYRYSDSLGNWKVRVFANKYPALRVEGAIDRRPEGLYDYISGVGAHEIIVDTPLHGESIFDLPEEQIEFLIRVYQARIRDLYHDNRLRYVLIYKNNGSGAGATLDHTHSQLVATPIIPQTLKAEFIQTKNYFEFKERCLFCDLLDQELNDGKRIITTNEDFVLFIPYASRMPFEMHIYPRKHNHDFSAITANQFKTLARIYKIALEKLKISLDSPAFNFILHTGPNIHAKTIPGQFQSIQEDYHWHIEIIPRLSRTAGFEWGTGFYINPSLPEDTAKFLRTMKI